MSLDVYLTMPHEVSSELPPREAIFVRQGGQTVEISREEWDERHPDKSGGGEVFTANITHNLGRMADEAGIYKPLWRPDELCIAKARELIEPLMEGIELMKREPERFKALNPSNGWGSYDAFVPWVERYIQACREYPDADVSVCR